MHSTSSQSNGCCQDSEIVISGISCRLPESDSLDEFKEHLLNGDDMVTEDNRRWEPGTFDLPRRNGKMKDISKFDASFFGVHPKQANTMDPQLRMVLEVTYEAICDAGVDPDSIRQTDTGVFVGCLLSETASVLTRDADKINGYSLTGCTRSMFANRVSFAFDFRGPSFAVDTACSSSLLALQLAMESMRQGQCNQAIVAGTHVLLIPTTDVQFLKLGMLSPKGMCQTFDENVDGYVRSEGVCVLFLQKRADAKRVYATVVHAKSNSDGYKEQGVTYPSGQRQTELLEAAYSEADVDPADVVYVEAHGTGTRAGDPEEANSITQVFCKSNRQEALLIGSVKSNMGHCEPTSGLASVAKLIIAMESGVLPKNLHFNQPNHNIPSLLDGRLKVVTENIPFGGGLVGVNSFGFGGSNVHAILRFDKIEQRPTEISSIPRIFCCSGRTAEGVQATLKFAAANASNTHLCSLLSELMFTPTNLHPYRGHVILNSQSEMVPTFEKCSQGRRTIWFIYSGMGTQWSGMGKDLLAVDVFRHSLQQCSDVLKRFGLDIFSMIAESRPEIETNNLFTVVSIVAVQIALTDTLRHLGLEPDGIIGHSVGELGCSYADGCLTMEETMLCAYWRGKCVEEAHLPLGGMAAVGLSWGEAKRRCPEGVVPACHNAEDSVTVSGPAEAVKVFLKQLQAEDIFAKEVNTTVPFHSAFMQKVAPALREKLSEVIKSPLIRSARWLSTSQPESAWESEEARHCSAAYHVNNVVSPVLFHSCLQRIPNHAVLIEIAPDALLQAILKRSTKANCSSVGLQSKKSEDQLDFFLNSLAKIYEGGVNFDIHQLYPSVHYPVPLGTPSLSSRIVWDHSQSWYVVNGQESVAHGSGAKVSCSYTVDPLNPEAEDQYLLDHVIDGRPLYPFAGYIFLAWNSLARLLGLDYLKTPVKFDNIVVHRATILNSQFKLEVSILPTTGNFTILESGTLVASGVISLLDKGAQFQLEHIREQPPCAQCGKFDLNSSDAYREILIRGYEYGPHFQSIHNSCKSCDNFELVWTGNWITFIDGIIQSALFRNRGDDTLQLPVRLDHLKIDPIRHLQCVETSVKGDVNVIRTKAALNMNGILAGGIEACDIISHSVARRIQPLHKPKLSKVCFVNYFDNRCLQMFPEVQQQSQQYSHFIRKYASFCASKFSLEPALDFIRAGSGKINGHLRDVNNVSNIGDEKDLSDEKVLKFVENPKCGMVRLLKELLGQTNGHKKIGTNGVTIDLPANISEALESDMLWSAVYLNPVVNPLLGMVLENTGGHFIRAAQLEPSSLKLATLSKHFLESHPLTETQWHVVVSDEGKQLPEEPGSQDIVQLQFSVSSQQKPPEEVRGLDLVIADRLLFQKPNIEEYLLRLKDFLRDDGFVLVNEFTSNHSLAFSMACLAESLNSTEIRDESNKEKRVFGYFLGHEQWLEMFVKCGFNVISWRTDKLMSTTYLIRKIRDAPLQPVFVNADDCAEFSWVDNLKKLLEERANSPPEQTVWIISKENPDNGIVGFAQCLREESPKNRARFIFNASRESPGFFHNGYLESAEIKAILDKDMFCNIYRDGEWCSIRHYLISEDNTPLTYKECEHAFMNTLFRGDLSSLTWLESSNQFWPQNAKPLSNKDSLVYVYYSALNFRDVMLATGRISSDSIPVAATVDERQCMLGCEFSGRCKDGRRVMGIAPCQALATTVCSWDHVLYDVPDSWTMEEAATLPMVYITSFYALIVRGRLRKGERVLIHSGTGGVGQAAIAVALSAGAEVFTTVGSEEKKRFLQSRFPELKDQHFNSSRTTDFLGHIMQQTQGKGVQVVLNSLSEDKLLASIKCLSKNGRFLEIGKFDIANNTQIGMEIFMKNVSFHGILLENLHDVGNNEWPEVSRLFSEGIRSGVVRPLPTTVFEAEKAQDAFRYMASGKHIGKVLVRIRQEEQEKLTVPRPVKVRAACRTYCDPNLSYIITGGLGGFGLELTMWLVNRGARKFVLTSRSGIRTAYQSRLIDYWRSIGVNIVCSTRDVSSLEDSEALLRSAEELGEVGGIFHLAMVLKDSYFENQTADNFKQSAQAKYYGTMYLDTASRKLCNKNLRWFVGFSSVASAFGNEGQTAYGWANSAMERIINQRVRDGLPGVSMQWGAIGDVGVVLEKLGDNNTVVGGTLPQRMHSCLATMDIFMSWNHETVLSYVRAETKKNSSDSQGDIVQTIAHVLGITDLSQIDPDANLGDLGLDSLMTVEIKRTLERDYDVVLSTKEIRFLTLSQLKLLSTGGAAALKAQYAETDSPASTDSSADNATSANLDSISPMAFFRLNVDPNKVRPEETLVKLNKVESGPSMFFVHTIEGVAQPLEYLAERIPAPVYCFQATPEAPKEEVVRLAAFYIEHLLLAQPSGPYHLMGYSYGAPVVLEMAVQLQAANPDDPNIVGSLVMLDGSVAYTQVYRQMFRSLYNVTDDTVFDSEALCAYAMRFVELDYKSFRKELLDCDSLAARVQLTVAKVMTSNLFDSPEPPAYAAEAVCTRLRAADRYKPDAKFVGDAVLIKAETRTSAIESSLPEDYGVASLITGNVKVHSVKGDHYSFIREDGAETVSSLLVNIVNKL